MARPSKTILWALWLLRIGLGMFLLLWSLDKIITPIETTALFSRYYWIDFSTSVVMILGSLELALSLMIILGLYKTLSYGAGLIIQIASVIAYYPELMNPFGTQHYFIAELPLLFAFIALFLVRDFDSKWALSKRPTFFSHH